MRKMSKLMSLLMVLVMVLMLVPASAFAAEEVVVGDPAPVVATDKTTADVPATVVDPAVVTAAVPVVDPATVPAVDPAAVPVVDPAAVPVVDPVAEAPVVVAEAPAVATAAVDEGTMQTMAVYLNLSRDGINFIDVLVNTVGPDYAYDAVANALTLDNFVGTDLNASDMGSAFAIILKGSNVIANSVGCAVDVFDGDVTIDGDGELVAIGQNQGIHVMNGDLTINGGSVEATGIASANDAYGIRVVDGDVIINDGYVDATAINTGAFDAIGLWADYDVIVNGGDIDAISDSVSGQSIGIGAGDDAIFNCGYTTSTATTDTGLATALYAGSWVVINHGILDLVASGGPNPLAIYGTEGVYIAPCYGDVDLSASSLYLACGCHGHHHKHCSANPKTGVQDTTQNALIATMSLVALMGMAYLISRKESQF